MCNLAWFHKKNFFGYPSSLIRGFSGNILVKPVFLAIFAQIHEISGLKYWHPLFGPDRIFKLSYCVVMRQRYVCAAGLICKSCDQHFNW